MYLLPFLFPLPPPPKKKKKQQSIDKRQNNVTVTLLWRWLYCAIVFHLGSVVFVKITCFWYSFNTSANYLNFVRLDFLRCDFYIYHMRGKITECRLSEPIRSSLFFFMYITTRQSLLVLVSVCNAGFLNNSILSCKREGKWCRHLGPQCGVYNSSLK